MLFGKKDKKTVAETENGEQKFEKDIKVLWIYTTLFCLFALVLIIISSVIQGKIHSDEEYYQDLYEGEKASSQSTIQNIQTENAALKAALEQYKKENENLANKDDADELAINSAAAIIENGDYLLKAQAETYTGSTKKAREALAKVDENALTEQMREVYNKLCKRLGV